MNNRKPPAEGRNAMEIILALAIPFVPWAIMILGSSYLNRNVG